MPQRDQSRNGAKPRAKEQKQNERNEFFKKKIKIQCLLNLN